MPGRGLKVVGASPAPEPAAGSGATAVAHEPAPPAPELAHMPKSVGVPRRVVVALGIVAMLGVGGTVGFATAFGMDQAKMAATARVQTVSRDFLMALTNFDAKNIDSDFSRIEGYSTGAFGTQARGFFGSASFRAKLQAAQASSRGQVRHLYVESLAGSHATVYSVVDQTYANNKTSTPKLDVLRVVLNLTKLPNGWHISQVTVLTPPAASAASSSGLGAASGG